MMLCNSAFGSKDKLVMPNENLNENVIDRSLLASVNKELYYQSYQDNASSFLYGCIGLGIMFILFSAGYLFFQMGYSTIVDNTSATKTIVKSLVASLSDVIIKVEAEGTVNISNPIMAIDENIAIKISPDSIVRLSPDSSVRIDASLKVVQPKPSNMQLGLDQNFANGLSPSTEYVIFKDIPFRRGSVTTGSAFSMLNNISPKYEYCFYRENIEGTKNIRVQIGKDGIISSIADNTKLPFKKEDAFALCQWSIY